MIQSENAPTLCPRCTNFTKGADVGCRIGDYGLEDEMALRIQRWLCGQSDEHSWVYLGECPGFVYNDSDPKFMSIEDQAALEKVLRRAGLSPGSARAWSVINGINPKEG